MMKAQKLRDSSMTSSYHRAAVQQLIRQSVQPSEPDFSLTRVLRSLAESQALNGFEGEVLSKANLYRGSGSMWGKTNVLPWTCCVISPWHRARRARSS